MKNRGLKQTKEIITDKEISIRLKQLYNKRIKENQETDKKRNLKTSINFGLKGGQQNFGNTPFRIQTLRSTYQKQ